MIIKLIVLIVVFCLLWYAIGLVPEPAAKFKWVLYILLIIVAVVVLLGLIGIPLP